MSFCCRFNCFRNGVDGDEQSDAHGESSCVGGDVDSGDDVFNLNKEKMDERDAHYCEGKGWKNGPRMPRSKHSKRRLQQRH